MAEGGDGSGGGSDGVEGAEIHERYDITVCEICTWKIVIESGSNGRCEC